MISTVGTGISPPPLPRGRSLFGWIVPASFLLHVAVMAALPATTPRSPPAALPPLILEAPPPVRAEAPSPPAAPAAPAETAETAPARSTNANASAPARRAAEQSSPNAAAAPLDFTGQVFSNEGPGLALGGGGGSAARVQPAVAPSAVKTAATAPVVVPVASLARKPRAPGLDAELERHFPAEARRSGIAGVAILRVTILADGRVGEVRTVSSTWPGFGPACVETVRAARWEPPIDRDGHPVATEIQYTCRFEVRS